MSRKVKFLQDFQGKETKEVFYRKDEVAEVADELIDQLLADKRVELVEPVIEMASEPQFENAYFGSQPEAEPRQDEVKFEKQKRGRK